MKNKKKTKNGAAKRGFLIAAIAVLAVILVLLIAAAAFIGGFLDMLVRPEEQETMSQDQIQDILDQTEPEDLNFTGEVLDPDDVTLPEAPVELVDSGENVVHILLVGQDTYSMTSRSRTDSMILCTINRSTKTLTLTSFMRDMYLRIPGYRSQRMNVAYVLGGFPTLYDTLEHNFGVVVEHGVAVNFASFEQVVDIVGGVEVELTAAEARHMNNNPEFDMDVEEGINLLDGNEALQYARIRKLDSDFNRTSRQRTVIMALIEQAKKLSIPQLLELAKTLFPMVVTDMSNDEILSLAAELAPMLSELTVVAQRIPADDAYRNVSIDGMAVLLPNLDKCRQLLVETIGDSQANAAEATE